MGAGAGNCDCDRVCVCDCDGACITKSIIKTWAQEQLQEQEQEHSLATATRPASVTIITNIIISGIIHQDARHSCNPEPNPPM